MADKKYKSPSTGEDCTGAQYITELILTRQASLGKDKLGHKFWNKEPWKTRFRVLIFQVNGFVRLYGEEVIIAVLNSKEGERIYSLKHDWVSTLFDKEVERRKVIEENMKVVEAQDNTESKPRQPFGQKNVKSKLRELE